MDLLLADFGSSSLGAIPCPSFSLADDVSLSTLLMDVGFWDSIPERKISCFGLTNKYGLRCSLVFIGLLEVMKFDLDIIETSCCFHVDFDRSFVV